MFYCPNALCMGCGGGWFRQKLESYEEIPGTAHEHTVNEDEWLVKGRTYNRKNGIRRTTFRRLKKLYKMVDK